VNKASLDAAQDWHS